MCWFITVSVPRGQEVALVRLGEEGSGVRVRAIHNPSLARALPEGDAQWLVTGRGCACGFYWSPDDPDPPNDDGEEGGEAELEAPIVLDDSLFDEAADRVDRRARRRFRETVAEMSRSLGAVRLFAHFYGGDVGSEVLGEMPTLTCSASAYLADRGAFPADTIVTVVPVPRGCA